MPMFMHFNYCNTMTVICRRRLPVVMVKCHMAQSVAMASKFVEQGRIFSTDEHILFAHSFIISVLLCLIRFFIYGVGNFVTIFFYLLQRLFSQKAYLIIFS